VSKQVGFDPYQLGEEFFKRYAEQREGWSHALSEVTSFRQDFEEFVAKVSRRGKGAGRPLVVFIDDLDRCHHDQVKRLLESIKVFLQSPGVFFVLALDEEQVLNALAESFETTQLLAEHRDRESAAHAKRYLEKFVQVAVDLNDGFTPLREDVRALRQDLWFLVGTRLLERANRFHDKVRSVVSPGAPMPAYEVETLGAVKYLLKSVKGNPRARKTICRWIYFMYPGVPLETAINKDGQLDTVTVETKKIWLAEREPLLGQFIRDFGEQAFAANFGTVWVNELRDETPDGRRTFFEALFHLFFVRKDDRYVPNPPSAYWPTLDQINQLGVERERAQFYGLAPEVVETEDAYARAAPSIDDDAPDMPPDAGADPGARSTAGRAEDIDDDAAFDEKEPETLKEQLAVMGVDKLEFFPMFLGELSHLASKSELTALQELMVIVWHASGRLPSDLPDSLRPDDSNDAGPHDNTAP
jgi:hypothetical protein